MARLWYADAEARVGATLVVGKTAHNCKAEARKDAINRPRYRRKAETGAT